MIDIGLCMGDYIGFRNISPNGGVSNGKRNENTVYMGLIQRAIGLKLKTDVHLSSLVVSRA